MKEYSFDPKLLLSYSVLMYINFQNYERFLYYIVNDPRSFKLNNFEKVIHLYNKKKLLLLKERDIEVFSKMIEKLKLLYHELRNQEVI